MYRINLGKDFKVYKPKENADNVRKTVNNDFSVNYKKHKEGDIILTANGSLLALLRFLELELESTISLNKYNYIVQDGITTNNFVEYIPSRTFIKGRM